MAEKIVSNGLDHSPLHLLHRAGRCAEEQFTLQLGATGLTPRQYAILLALDEHGSMHQVQIVARTGIDRSTVSDTIRRLLLKGFVERKQGSVDARNYNVQLSNDGRKILKVCDPLAQRADEKILAVLTPQSRKQFLGHLRAILVRLGAAGRIDKGS